MEHMALTHMFNAADVINDRRLNNACLVRMSCDLDLAESAYTWLKDKGFDCEQPLSAMWKTDDAFKVFGYLIKVNKPRRAVIRKLDLH